MSRWFTTLAFLSLVFITNIQANDSITVYIFLHEDCPISQYYTLQLNELEKTYSHDKLQFVGIFPNFSSKKEKIEAFKVKYQIDFKTQTDYFKTLTKKFGATITPEIVIFNHGKDTILYQGRIDNTFFRVGKRRRITTTQDLKDALEAITTGVEIINKKTDAVGCFINFNDLKTN